MNALADLMKMGVSPAEIAKRVERERLKRAAPDDLIAFTQYTFPRYKPAAHHYAIGKVLHSVLFGDLDRVMILTGPRHGKSELCSRRFPAWALGNKPELQFISTSAGMDLAQTFGGEVRDLVGSPEYKDIFAGTELKEDATAKGRWRTSQGGIYSSFGVGGKPVGWGGDIIMIDDPFGSMEDAQSETIRRKVHDWFTGTIYHRLQPGGKIVLINHRMHDDDLSGFLLERERVGGDQWFVLCLPAELNKEAAEYLGRKPGEALWPEAFPLEALHRIRNNIGTRHYSALYLQDPAAAEDGIFKRDWFNFWNAGDPLPVFDFIIQSYDTAFTDKTANDPTASVTLGVFTQPNGQKGVMLIDCWEDWLSYRDVRETIRTEWENTSYGASWQAEDDGGPIIHDMNNPMFGTGAKVAQGRKADVVLIEEKGSGIAIIQELRRGGRVPVRADNPGRYDKTSRAHSIAPYVEAGRVWVPQSEVDKREFTDWADALLQQLCQYKTEGSIKHDDLLDAFVQAMLFLVRNGFISTEDEEEDDYVEDDEGYDEPPYG